MVVCTKITCSKYGVEHSRHIQICIKFGKVITEAIFICFVGAYRRDTECPPVDTDLKIALSLLIS